MPEELLDKRILSLDLSGMVAGTKYRGEFEERIKNTLNEVKKDGNVILFIDELHTIVGAGSAEGAVDAANILKPALSRGEIRVIGATTLNEYRKYIEKDAALERRFQPVTVGEPTPEATLEILKGLRDRYEAHHKLTITDEALDAAVQLSKRYIGDRFLPDKAIDLMDEAASPGPHDRREFLSGPEGPGGEDHRPAPGEERCHRRPGLREGRAAARYREGLPGAGGHRARQVAQEPVPESGHRHRGRYRQGGGRLDRYSRHPPDRG